MAPQTPSSSSVPIPGSNPSPVAPLMTELYTFDTLLLTFLGRKAALPSTPPTPTITQTNPQDSSNGASNANAYADTDAANAAAQRDQKTTPTSSSSSSPSIPSPPPTSPSLIDEALKALLSKVISSLPTGAIPSSDEYNSSASSSSNLTSWLELLSPPSPSGSSPSSTSPSGSGKSSTSSDDFVGGKSTMVHGAIAGSTGGGGRYASGARVRGGITLAYQACQMLPEPIHLRHVNTTLLPLTIIAPSSNGTSTSNGDASQDSYAIEYFADQGCTQFVMATAGTRVNVWQAELDLVESNSEKEGEDGVERYDSSRGGESGTTRKRDGDDGFFRVARRQSSPPPAAILPPSSPLGTYTPWTPPPTTKQELKGLDMVVSVRWVGILRPTEFKMSKALIASRRPPNQNRLLVDPLLERRSDVNNNDIGNDGNDGHGGDNNADTPSSPETVTEIDERKDGGSKKGATGDGTGTPTTPLSLPVLSMQRGKVGGGDGVVGFVSWTPFNETTQLQAPTRRDTGSFPLDDMVFNLALREKVNSLNGTRDSTSTAAAAGGGGGHVGMAHMTSQIVMAGLIAGLLLILGSLLTAVYYRQRRRKWYEEDGDV